MRNVIILILVLLAAVPVLAQNNANVPTSITIGNSEVNNGVVIITARHGVVSNATNTAIELQCNKGNFSCNIPEPGTYQMVRLPQNYGTYECMNVDLYPNSADPKSSTMIGEYCLIEK